MNQTIDKRFLEVPFLRLAEIIEEGTKVPQAIRQMLREMDHFVAAHPITRENMTLANWKSSIEVPRLKDSNRQSASL